MINPYLIFKVNYGKIQCSSTKVKNHHSFIISDI